MPSHAVRLRGSNPVTTLLLLVGFLGFLVLGLLALVARLRASLASAEGGRRAIESLLEEIGAKRLDEETWEWNGRRYRVDCELPGLAGGPARVRLALYTPRSGQLTVSRASGLPVRFSPKLGAHPFYREYWIEGVPQSAIEEFLLQPDVAALLSHLLPGRWKSFGKRVVELYLAGNEQDPSNWTREEIQAALVTLARLDQPWRDPNPRVITFRSGFEEDLLPWHWTGEQVASLPEETRRIVISLYEGGPLLNEGLVRIFQELGGGPGVFLTPAGDLFFLRHAFGDCFEREGRVFRSSIPAVPAAADAYLEGKFFGGFAAVSQAPKRWRTLAPHEFDRALREHLSEARLIARRLWDEEGAWYSGEYELLTVRMTDEEILGGLERAATALGARIVEIESRFHPKMFRDEEFDFTAG